MNEGNQTAADTSSISCLSIYSICLMLYSLCRYEIKVQHPTSRPLSLFRVRGSSLPTLAEVGTHTDVCVACLVFVL